MKKIFRAVLVLFALSALAAAGLAVFLKVKYPPEKMKELVIAQAEKHLHRQVKLGAVSAGLFTGLSLADLEVSERPDFQAGRFLASRSLSIKPFLLPLLKGEIVIKSVELDGPEVRVVRRADGTFNFSDLAGGETAPSPSTAPASPAAAAARGRPGSSDGAAAARGRPGLSDGAAAAPPKLFVNRLALRGGNVAFEDRSPAAMSAGLSGLNLTVTAFSLTAPFSFDVSADVNGLMQGKPLSGRIAAAGRLSIADPLTLELKESAVEAPGLSLSAKGWVKDLAAPKLDLTVEVKNAEAKAAAPFAETPPEISDAKISGTLKVDGDLAKCSVSGDLRVSAAGVRSDVALTATLAGLDEEPTVDGKLTFAKLSLDGAALPEGLKLSGQAAGSLAVKGGAKDASVKLELDGKDLAVAYADMFAKPAGEPLSVAADASVKNADSVRLHSATVSLDPVKLTARGYIDDISGAGRLDVAVQAASFPLKSLERWTSLTKEYGLTGSASVDATVKGPFAAPKVQGKAAFQGLSAVPAAGLNVTELTGSASFTDDSLDLADARGKLNGSPLALGARVRNFDRPEVVLEGRLEKLDVAPLLAAPAGSAPAAAGGAGSAPAAAPAPPGPAPLAKLRGTFTLGLLTHPQYEGRDFRLEWDVSDAGPYMGWADGTAALTAANGRIRDVPVARKLNKLLKKDASEIPYEKMSGRFKIADGLMSTDDFVVTGPTADIAARGTVHLVTLAADLRMTMKLPAGSLGGSAGDWFAGDDGRPTLEAAVKGPLTDPSVQVDLAKAAKRAAEDLLRKGLEKLRRAPEPAETAPGQAPAEPSKRDEQIDKAVEKGQKALEKLFKKR